MTDHFRSLFPLRHRLPSSASTVGSDTGSTGVLCLRPTGGGGNGSRGVEVPVDEQATRCTGGNLGGAEVVDGAPDRTARRRVGGGQGDEPPAASGKLVLQL